MVLTQGAETVDHQQQKQLQSKRRKRTVESSTRTGFLPQQMGFFLNNILMFGINTTLGHIFTNLYPKEITCASSTVSTSGPAQGYLGIFRTSPGWVAMSFIPTDITCTFMVISWIP